MTDRRMKNPPRTMVSKRPIADEDVYRQVDRCIDCGVPIYSQMRPNRKPCRFYRCCACTADLFARDPQAGARP